MKKLLLFILSALLTSTAVFAQNSTHLNFDGNNDVASMGNGITSYLAGKNAFTIEATVRPEVTTGFGVIAGNYNYPTHNDSMQFMLRRENKNYVFFVYSETNSYAIGAENTAVNNEWQHVAGVLTSDSLKIFVDGKQMNSRGFSGVLPAISNDFVLGGNTINENFNGDIEEVRIWNKSVSNIDIARRWACELTGSESNLLAYYQLNNDTVSNQMDTTITDLTNNGYNGAIRNFDFSGISSDWSDSSSISTESTIPQVPSSASNQIIFNIDDTATSLTATTSAQGLMWYISETSLSGSDVAPIPKTNEIDSTNYWVSSYDFDGCESERYKITVIVKDALSVEDKNLSLISTFPNPTNLYLNVETTTNSTFSMYNTLGQLVLNSTLQAGITSLDVSNVPNGTYNAIIENQSERHQSTIIIK